MSQGRSPSIRMPEPAISLSNSGLKIRFVMARPAAF
jgi:hypothetical protein